jgi:hypothetical protein
VQINKRSNNELLVTSRKRPEKAACSEAIRL